MYYVTVRETFTADHFFPYAAGDEARQHSHEYEVAVRLAGERLDERGYLVDIVAVRALLHVVIGRYRGRLLNGTEAFRRLNPSIENFSRVFWEEFAPRLEGGAVSEISVTIAEDRTASAAYREKVNAARDAEAVHLAK